MPYLSRLSRRLAVRTAAVAMLAVVVACSDTTAPVEAVSPQVPTVLLGKKLSLPDIAAGMLRTKRLAKGDTVYKSIGPKGGSFDVPGGLKITVPPGAVDSTVRFSAAVLPGSAVAYEFGPHGLTFHVPVKFEQKLDGTNWKDLPPGHLMKVQVGYYSDLFEESDGSVEARVTEWSETALDVVKGKLVADLWHFSGYMVSSGRR